MSIRGKSVQIPALAAAGLLLGLFAAAAQKTATPARPGEVLTRLLEGNKRYSKGEPAQPRRKPEDFAPLAKGQHPVAAIVGCADSRVAPELLFDQGIGDLFVIRVAGNVISGAGASVKGSIEYAVAELGVPLVVVLGHSQCGAIKAAITHAGSKDALPGSIGELVETIEPVVAGVKGDPGDLLDNAIKANVKRGVERLERLEPILADAARKGKVRIVGATYDLLSGKVTVFE